MLRLASALLLGVMTTFVLADSVTFATPVRTSAIVTVQIQCQANVSPKTMFDARADMIELYRKAGIALLWVTTDADLVIVLADNGQASGVDTHTIGRAVVNGRTRKGRVGFVFFDRVEDLAATIGVTPGDLLGHVIAHEMAHLLGVSHAERGLMRAEWDATEIALASQGLLYFSPAQSQVMRASLATRNGQ